MNDRRDPCPAHDFTAHNARPTRIRLKNKIARFLQEQRTDMIVNIRVEFEHAATLRETAN